MPRGFSHLDLSERIFIETQLILGMRPAGIAAELKRAGRPLAGRCDATVGELSCAREALQEASAVGRLIQDHAIGC